MHGRSTQTGKRAKTITVNWTGKQKVERKAGIEKDTLGKKHRRGRPVLWPVTGQGGEAGKRRAQKTGKICTGGGGEEFEATEQR